MKTELPKYKKKKPSRIHGTKKREKGCLAILASPPAVAKISPPNSLTSLR